MMMMMITVTEKVTLFLFDQVKLAKFVSGVPHAPRSGNLNRETYAVMSKTLQATKRGEEGPPVARMKDNTEKMYMKYMSNMTAARKLPNKAPSRGETAQFILRVLSII